MNTPIKDLFALAEEAIAPVIWTEKKALKKFKESVTPERVREVAEAFRALEQERDELRQRAESAEAELEDTDRTMCAYSDQLVKVTDALVSVQSKLADLKKQQPIYQVRLIDGGENCSDWIEVTEEEFNTPVTDKYGKWEHRKLFTRPAPAINLAELVPPKMVATADMVLNDIIEASIDGWNDCRDAMLRNIKEAK